MRCNGKHFSFQFIFPNVFSNNQKKKEINLKIKCEAIIDNPIVNKQQPNLSVSDIDLLIHAKHSVKPLNGYDLFHCDYWK